MLVLFLVQIQAYVRVLDISCKLSINAGIKMTAGDLLLEGNARLQGWWVWIRKRFPELIKAVGADISDEAIEGGCSLILR